jgi:hypothetical protein
MTDISNLSQELISNYTQVFNEMTDPEWSFLARKLNLTEEDAVMDDTLEEELEGLSDEEFEEFEEFEELEEFEITQVLEEITATSNVLFCTCPDGYIASEPSPVCIGVNTEERDTCALNPLADFSFGTALLKDIFSVRPNDQQAVFDLLSAVVELVPIMEDLDISRLLEPSVIKGILFHMIFTVSVLEGTGYWYTYREENDVGFVYHLVDGYLKTICSELSDMFEDMGDDTCHNGDFA